MKVRQRIFSVIGTVQYPLEKQIISDFQENYEERYPRLFVPCFVFAGKRKVGRVCCEKEKESIKFGPSIDQRFRFSVKMGILSCGHPIPPHFNLKNYL
jgi:hypothetical protein